jgi:hypothetical protein
MKSQLDQHYCSHHCSRKGKDCWTHLQAVMDTNQAMLLNILPNVILCCSQNTLLSRTPETEGKRISACDPIRILLACAQAGMPECELPGLHLSIKTGHCAASLHLWRQPALLWSTYRYREPPAREPLQPDAVLVPTTVLATRFVIPHIQVTTGCQAVQRAIRTLYTVHMPHSAYFAVAHLLLFIALLCLQMSIRLAQFGQALLWQAGASYCCAALAVPAREQQGSNASMGTPGLRQDFFPLCQGFLCAEQTAL